jgi:hypothetical protein
MTLIDFLLARIAEDEAVARGADPLVTGLRVSVWTCDKYGHVAVDPARVLAECEAKRRILSNDTLTYGERTNGER